jgi:hypothetical protein
MYGICTNICPKSHPDVGKYTSTMEHMGTRLGLKGLSQRLHMGGRSVRIMVGFYSFFMVLRDTPVTLGSIIGQDGGETPLSGYLSSGMVYTSL